MAINFLSLIVVISGIFWLASAVPDCPEVDEGVAVYLPDENDCGSFYECSNSVAQHFSCPPGTYFDLVKKVCNHIENLDCGLRPTTQTPPTESTDFETTDVTNG